MAPQQKRPLIEKCSIEELQALRKSEEHLRVTLSSIGDAVIATDDQGKVTMMNPVAATLTGWQPEDAVGKDLNDVFHIINAKTRKKTPNPIHKVLSLGKIVGLANHTILISKDGKEHQIADSAAPIKDASGHIFGVILVFRDVTQEYKAAENLKESEYFLRESQAVAQIGSYILDIPTGVWMGSPILNEAFGITESYPHTIDSWAALIHPDDRAMMTDYFAKEVVGKGQSFDKEYRIVRQKDKALRWVHGLGKLEFDSSGHPTRMLGTIQDITDRISASYFLKLILDNIPDYVFWKDRNSVFLGCNNNIARAAGLRSPDEIIGKTDYDLGWTKEESDFFVATDRRIMESNKAEYHIIEPQHQADGSQAWLDTCKVPLHDEQGNVIGILGTYTDITERKRLEETLSLFKDSLENASDAIGISTPQGKHFYQNKAFDDLFGSLGQNPSVVYVDQQVCKDVFDAIMAGKTWTGEVKMYGINHRIRDIFIRAYASRDPHGNINALVGIHTDITDRKQAQEEQEASLKRFQNVAKASPMGMHFYEIESDGRLVFTGANPSADLMLGVNHDSFIGKTIEEAFPALINTEVPARYKHAARYGTPWRTEQIDYQSGSIKGAFEVVAFQTEPNKMVAMFNDITSRKQAEYALHASELSLQTILQSTADGILAVDSENKILCASAKFAELWNLPREIIASNNDTLLLHHVLDQLIDPQGFLQKVQLLYKSSAESFDTLNFKDGRVFERLSRPLIQDGKPNGRVWSFRDITSRKQAEAREKELQGKLERSARMESLGVLAGGVAHDLNNILSPLVALPDMATEYILRCGNPADPEHSATLDSLKVIKASALRAAAVVGDLVVMGRRGQFAREPISVNKMVEKLLESKQIQSLQGAYPNIKISTQLSTEALWCQGSESRLARILANLTSNAVEAIGKQGEVTIRTRHMTFTTPYQGYELVPPGEYVSLEVADTGCGMNSKTIARIFEPFFSTKSPSERSGSGLGLSVVHGLVKDHDGFVDVRSTPGKGSTFAIYLPMRSAGEEIQEPSDIFHLPGGTERILVVDDEPGQRFLTQQLLKKMGYASTVVATGEEAIALFEVMAHQGKPAPFDLVLTDMLMDGMDGLTVCRAILKLYPSQKLVLMSGHVPDGYEIQARSLSAEWLNKPFTPLELASAVRMRLDGK